MCLLSNDIHDYYNVAQGKITIPNVDDGEECLLTDVSESDYKAVPVITNPWQDFLPVTLYCKIQNLNFSFTIKIDFNGRNIRQKICIKISAPQNELVGALFL